MRISARKTIFVLVFAMVLGIGSLVHLDQATAARAGKCEDIFSGKPQRVARPRLAPSISPEALIEHFYTEGSSKGSVYSNVYKGLSKAQNAEKVRATESERIANAVMLTDPASKFAQISDKQLQAQWGASELSLNPDEPVPTLGQINGLKRGDRIHLGRQIELDARDLEELFKIRKITGFFHHRLNYDDAKVQELYNKLGFDLYARLGFNLAWGGLGISTTYFAQGWAWPPSAGRDDLTVSKPTGSSGTRKYTILLRFAVPVEALVIMKRDQPLPSHVVANPSGFGIVQPATGEGEVTFIDLIPIEWVTNLQDLEQAYRNSLLQ